jgi:hypothetical protein
MKIRTFCVLTVFTLSMFFGMSLTFGQGTAFTYQGRLNQNGAPFTGSAEFQASLWSVPSGGSALANNLGGSVVVGVTNGLFVLPLDFGANFSGGDRWLELDVRTALGSFTQLSPRQQVTPAPYAIYAGNVNATGISGSIADAQLSANIARLNGSNLVFTGQVQFNNTNSAFHGTFAGNGAGITNVSLTALNSFGSINWDQFIPTTPIPAGSEPAWVITPDVNGDGRADIVSANAGGNTLSVLTNNGNGGFVLSSSPTVGNGPDFVFSADVNGDGKPDLVAANFGGIAGNGNTLTVLTNDGSGGFVISSSPPVGAGPVAVAAGDFNGDGRMDLASANYTAGTITILVQAEGGGFSPVPSPLNANGHPVALVATNFTGLTGDTHVGLLCAATSTSGVLDLFQGDGGGFFSLVGERFLNNNPYAAAGADLNGDGVLEMITADPVARNLVVYNFNGNIATTLPVPGGPHTVTVADVNDDHRLDLITANVDNTVSILTNDGSGGFAISASPVASDDLESIAAADLNGDGKIDLIGANYDEGNLLVLLNAPHFHGAFTGDGSGLLGLDAGNLSTGVLADARLSANVALLNADQTFAGQNTFNNPGNNFTGNGAGLTSLSAGNINSGTLANARLSANVTLLNSNQVFSGVNTFSNANGLQLATNTSLMFGTQTRQMLNLWGTQYGIGVQSYTLYFRTDNSFPGGGFAWYQGGTSSDLMQNPGAGGKTLMTLDGTGSLRVTNNIYAAGVMLTSDRNAKENFAPIDPGLVLRKVAALPITRWNFKQDSGVLHIGPMAQDFSAAFGVGEDDKHIAVVDEGGVALAAIQGLNQKLEQKDTEIAELKRRLEKLEKIIDLK